MVGFRQLSGQDTTGDFNLNGFLVGPTIGANVQVDSFVFGLKQSGLSGRNIPAGCCFFGLFLRLKKHSIRRPIEF